MNVRTLTAAALGLVLATSALAMTFQSTGSGRPTPPKGTSIVAVHWAPDWLVASLKKAIADATDPRERTTKAK